MSGPRDKSSQRSAYSRQPEEERERDRERDAIGEMLAWAADVDQTPEEAEDELRAAGVDVDGFLARVHERVREAAL